MTPALGDDLDKALCARLQSLDDKLGHHLCAQQTEPDIRVAVIRPPVVAIGRTAVLRGVVPTATTVDAVGARYDHHANLKISFLLRQRLFAC